MSRAIAGGVLLIAIACGPAGGAGIEGVGSVHPRATRTPTTAPQTETTPAPAPVPAAFKGSLDSFPGCDAPDPVCHCDDRVLAVPHRELDRSRLPEPRSGQLVIASVDLHPLEVTYFAPVLLNPPGICLSGPCPTESPVRFELVGPRGRTTRRYGTWSCETGDARGQCKGPIDTWSGSSMTDAWLDIAPDDETLQLFVSDQLVYSTSSSYRPSPRSTLRARENARAGNDRNLRTWPWPAL